MASVSVIAGVACAAAAGLVHWSSRSTRRQQAAMDQAPLTRIADLGCPISQPMLVQLRARTALPSGGGVACQLSRQATSFRHLRTDQAFEREGEYAGEWTRTRLHVGSAEEGHPCIYLDDGSRGPHSTGRRIKVDLAQLDRLGIDRSPFMTKTEVFHEAPAAPTDPASAVSLRGNVSTRLTDNIRLNLGGQLGATRRPPVGQYQTETAVRIGTPVYALGVVSEDVDDPFVANQQPAESKRSDGGAAPPPVVLPDLVMRPDPSGVFQLSLLPKDEVRKSLTDSIWWADATTVSLASVGVGLVAFGICSKGGSRGQH